MKLTKVGVRNPIKIVHTKARPIDRIIARQGLRLCLRKYKKAVC